MNRGTPPTQGRQHGVGRTQFRTNPTARPCDAFPERGRCIKLRRDQRQANAVVPQRLTHGQRVSARQPSATLPTLGPCALPRDTG
jgi:hypothetical protein